MLFRFGTKSQLIFDWQQIPRSEPVTLHYRRTLRWYGQRTLRPSKVELSIEEHFGYAAGDPTPLLIAKLRLPDVSHLVASNVQNPPAIRPNQPHSTGSSTSGHNSAGPADTVATSTSDVLHAGGSVPTTSSKPQELLATSVLCVCTEASQDSAIRACTQDFIFYFTKSSSWQKPRPAEKGRFSFPLLNFQLGFRSTLRF